MRFSPLYSLNSSSDFFPCTEWESLSRLVHRREKTAQQTKNCSTNTSNSTHLHIFDAVPIRVLVTLVTDAVPIGILLARVGSVDTVVLPTRRRTSVWLGLVVVHNASGLIHLHQGMSHVNACIRLCSECRCLCRAGIGRGSRRCRCPGHTCSHCRPIPRYTETRTRDGMSGWIQAEYKQYVSVLMRTTLGSVPGRRLRCGAP